MDIAWYNDITTTLHLKYWIILSVYWHLPQNPFPFESLGSIFQLLSTNSQASGVPCHSRPTSTSKWRTRSASQLGSSRKAMLPHTKKIAYIHHTFPKNLQEWFLGSNWWHCSDRNDDVTTCHPTRHIKWTSIWDSKVLLPHGTLINCKISTKSPGSYECQQMQVRRKEDTWFH